jgi:hypothetical protein
MPTEPCCCTEHTPTQSQSGSWRLLIKRWGYRLQGKTGGDSLTTKRSKVIPIQRRGSLWSGLSLRHKRGEMAKNHIAALFWAKDAYVPLPVLGTEGKYREQLPDPLAMTNARFITYDRKAGDALMAALAFIRAADGREAFDAMEPMNEEGVSTNGETVLNMAWLGKRKIKAAASLWLHSLQGQAIPNEDWEAPWDIAARGYSLLAQDFEESEVHRTDDPPGPWSAVPPH